MNCLETSAIIDYLEGEEAIGRYLQAHDGEPYFTPTVALHEVFVGAARRGGSEAVGRVREDLDWIEPIPFTAPAAANAAVLDAELLADGAPIGTMDAIIAGAVREVGGTLITADAGFEDVPGLDVERYRE